MVTWNPSDKQEYIELSNGNMTAKNTGSSSAMRSLRATLAKDGGKWFYEVLIEAGINFLCVGIADSAHTLLNLIGSWNGASYFTNVGQNKSQKYRTSYYDYGALISIGDVVGVAVDLDAHSIEFYLNGVSQGVAFTNLAAETLYFPAATLYTTQSQITARFRAVDCTYPIPDGYQAWDQTIPGVISEVLKRSYTCTIAGSQSIDIPIATIQMSRRNAKPSYMAIVVPSVEQFDQVNARIGTEMILKLVLQYVDGTETVQEIARANLREVRTEETPNKQIMTLVAYKQTTYGAGQTWEIPLEGYTINAGGKLTFRSVMTDNLINPGDAILFEDEPVTIGEIRYTIAPGIEKMQIVEA